MGCGPLAARLVRPFAACHALTPVVAALTTRLGGERSLAIDGRSATTKFIRGGCGISCGYTVSSPISTLMTVEGRRWATKDSFGAAKTELGLAHNETQSQHGWHQHVSLVMFPLP